MPIDDDHRCHFFTELQHQVAATRQDPSAWVAEVAERQALDGTLLDGLDPDEAWTDADVLPPAPTTPPVTGDNPRDH